MRKSFSGFVGSLLLVSAVAAVAADPPADRFGPADLARLAAVGEPAVEPTAVSDAVGPLLAWEQPGRSPDVAQLDVRTEQSSDPASRITLGKERDASGLRQLTTKVRCPCSTV